MFFIIVSFASTCFLAWAISGGSLTVLDAASTAAPAAAAWAEALPPPAVPPPAAPAPAVEEKPPFSVARGRERRKRRVRRLRPLRLLDKEELLLEEEIDLGELLLFEGLRERLFTGARVPPPLLPPPVGFLGLLLDRLLDFLGGFEGTLLRLLLELFLDDRLAERLEEELPPAASDVGASESLYFRGAFLPKQRRSLLP